MADNVFLDREEYAASLANLDPITRRQLEDGDWTASSSGTLFRREWFPVVDALPAGAPGVRYWDLAATEPSDENKDPDWTASCRMHRGADGVLYIADVRRLRARPGDRDRAIRTLAEQDGRALPIVIEQEPGASGKSQVEYLVRDLLQGWNVAGDRKTGDKFTRAGPLASQAQIGNVRLLRGLWNHDFLSEIEAFPNGAHDDQVDAASGAFSTLATRPRQAVGVRF
jgi:predicted phage terminase large subunit-like protein